MNELSCEEILMAQMAAADGEEPAFSTEQLAAHLVGCGHCQKELKQLQALDHVLARHTLAEPNVELWPAIENRIAKGASPVASWKPFALIGPLLVIYKLLELVPTDNPGMALKVVPLIIVALLFVFIKENPFKINTDLVLER